MRIVLFGAPGAGKGTQADRLKTEFGLLHLSTGEILRKAIGAKTALGQEAQRFMDRGDLVPDDVVIGIVKEALQQPAAAKGFILDGFPRTVHQAQVLGEFLAGRNQSLTRVISLEVKEEELVARILSRSKESQIQRADDNDGTIRARFKSFETQTLPLKDFYRSRDLLVEIEGNSSVETVYAAVRVAAQAA